MSHGSARQHFHDAVNLDRQADVVRKRPADNFVFGLLAVKVPDPRPIADGDHVARFDKVLRIVDLPPVLQKMAVPDALPVLRPSPCKAGATLVRFAEEGPCYRSGRQLPFPRHPNRHELPGF